MARTTGPLLSFDASGSVGGAIVFSKWKGRNYVRQLVIPSNPQTPSQTAYRSFFKFLAQNWAAIDPTDQDSWNGLADGNKVSDFNAYMAKNQGFVKNGLYPSQNVAHDAILDPADTPVITATGGVGMASLSINPNTVEDNWGYQIFRKLGSAPTGSFTETIAVVLGTADPTVYVDSPLAAGTWHYKVVPFSTDGNNGLLSADANAVVT